MSLCNDCTRHIRSKIPVPRSKRQIKAAIDALEDGGPSFVSLAMEWAKKRPLSVMHDLIDDLCAKERLPDHVIAEIEHNIEVLQEVVDSHDSLADEAIPEMLPEDL